MAVYTGDYRELVSTLMLFQAERVPVWMITNVKIDDSGNDTYFIDIYRAMRDWLVQHRLRLDAILVMLNEGDYEPAKEELKRMMEEVTESVKALDSVSNLYKRMIAVRQVK